MNAGEAADDDGQTTEEVGHQSGMFMGGAFDVVVITDDNPLDATVTVVGSGRWDGSPLACLEVLASPLAELMAPIRQFCTDNVSDAKRVDTPRTRNTVLEPWATGGDVISR